MEFVRIVAILALTLQTPATSTVIRTLDSNGEPFSNVLIIIKSLDDRTEVGRFLTDSSGRCPRVALGPGLYRVIALCPYGLCATTVCEILGTSAPSELELLVPVNPTDLSGEVVAAPRVNLVVVTPTGPAGGARLLVRDPEARREEWYRTDENGRAQIELPTDPSVVVVVYGGKVDSHRVTADTVSRENDDRPKQTHPASPRTITLRLDPAGS